MLDLLTKIRAQRDVSYIKIDISHLEVAASLVVACWTV